MLQGCCSNLPPGNSRHRLTDLLPDFELLNSLFPNPDGRAFTPGKVVALEFQAQLAGQAEPLLKRARRLRERVEAYQAARVADL